MRALNTASTNLVRCAPDATVNEEAIRMMDGPQHPPHPRRRRRSLVGIVSVRDLQGVCSAVAEPGFRTGSTSTCCVETWRLIALRYEATAVAAYRRRSHSTADCFPNRPRPKDVTVEVWPTHASMRTPTA